MQVSIGSPERGLEFAELTSFPSENLLADPENVTYDALGLTRNALDTYFNPRVGLFTIQQLQPLPYLAGRAQHSAVLGAHLSVLQLQPLAS